MTALDHRQAVGSDWIERARAVTTASVLHERGILKGLKGRNGQLAGPCPDCGGNDRFGVNLKKGCGGVFHCRGCGASGGDAIALVQFLDGCGFLRAVETLAGPPPDGSTETDDERCAREAQAIERRERLERERIECEAREAAELQETIQYCDRLWAETVPLPPEAIAYFAVRGITLDEVPDQGGLRFHRAYPFDGITLPCIVARFTDPVTNELGGLWRRPIGGRKPKSLGPIRRQVIRLWSDEHVEQGLVIGEGVETVLSAALGRPHNGTQLQPAWACGGTDSLRHFPLLNGIGSLTIISDNDVNGAGQDAASDCADRWEEAGRWVEILTPKAIGADFNDLKRWGEI